MMRKLYIILLFITCCGFLSAQSYLPIDVKVKLVQKGVRDGSNLTGWIIKCDSKSEAKDYQKKYKKAYDSGKNLSEALSSLGVPESRTIKVESESSAVISISSKGSILVFVDGMNKESELILEEIKGRTEISITVAVRQLTEVKVSGTNRFKTTIDDMPAESHGLKVEIRNLITVLDKYAQNNGRFVLQPVVYRGCEFDSVFNDTTKYKVLHSYVVDGEEYFETQNRRMLFDERHDPLTKWRVKKNLDDRKNGADSVLLMQTRKETQFRVNDSFLKEDKKQKVNVQAYFWYEDYNRLYHEEMACLSSCRMRDPMRFLECDSMLSSYPIESKLTSEKPESELHYWERPRREAIKEPGNLSLKFKTGQAELDPNDSVGLSNLIDLRERLGVLSNDSEIEFHGITIEGQASPDGRYARNETLGKERMLYAVREATSLLKVKSKDQIIAKSRVAGWDMVADTLMTDSTTVGLAERIREIVKSLPGRPDEQWKRIKAMPEYQTLILPTSEKLRTISYSYAYTKHRILEPEEILERWRTDEDYRTGKKDMAYYEYCYLFEFLKNDTAAMQKLSERAYKRFTKYRKYNAPWPLAAYHYAQSKLRNGICDTTILLPYIDKALPPSYSRSFEGVEEVYYNDPAIISLQVAIKAELGDYESAWFWTFYLPESPGTKRMRAFLGCLCGKYREDNEDRRLVINSSPINKVVIYTALNTEGYNEEATKLLNDTTLFPNQSAYNVLYIKSILAARKKNDSSKKAAWLDLFEMLKECPYIYQLWKLDEKSYNEVLEDGEFANNVRNDFIKLWDFYKRYGDEHMQHLIEEHPDYEPQWDSKKKRYVLYVYDSDGVKKEVQELQY